MSNASKARLSFMASPEQGVIVIRPIGDMPARSFIDALFEAYAQVDAPWKFNRLNDFRRFDGYLRDEDIAEIATRWRGMTEGQTYHAHVALVTHDHLAKLRMPSVNPLFPNETICLFADFYQAMGWLKAADRAAYIAGLSPKIAPARMDARIMVE